MKKLKSSKAVLTETLKKEALNRLLESLFPNEEEIDTSEFWRAREQIEVDGIYASDVNPAMNGKKSVNTTPGVDGIKMRALRSLTEQEQSVMARCFTKCLEEGKFPREWKSAYLVLIPKDWPLENPKVRPICLLNEMGKIFETIIVERLNSWIEDNPRSGLAENQFGFRKGRSTTDALILVKSIIEETRRKDGVTIAISIDVQNAFNSLPWDIIRNALRRKGFPKYLRRVIEDYLNNRQIEYIGEDGGIHTRKMLAGVPQKLRTGPGPLEYWNIGYDSVLQEGADPGCHVICYADDMLVLATAYETRVAVVRANVQVAGILNRIGRIGLKVAAHKTEAGLFPGRKKNRTVVLDVDGTLIGTKPSMKYLGIILDGKLSFEGHFEYIKEKASKISGALSRILPNLRGPHESRRKLFANVVVSVALYAAPV